MSPWPPALPRSTPSGSRSPKLKVKLTRPRRRRRPPTEHRPDRHRRGTHRLAVLRWRPASRSRHKGNVLASYGRSSVNDLDHPAFRESLRDESEAASEPMTRIYGSFADENMEVTDTKGMFACSSPAWTAATSWLGPPRIPGPAPKRSLSEMGGKDNLSPEERSGYYADRGYSQRLPDRLHGSNRNRDQIRARGREGAASSATGRINRMAYAGRSAHQPADMRMEGLRSATRKNA